MTEPHLADADRLLTITDVADIYNVPVSTVRAWNREGKIPTGFMLGKHLRWKASAVSADIQRRADEAAAKVRQAVTR